MTDISMKQIQEITPFWLFYTKDSGNRGSIQFSACANTFSVQRGGCTGCVGVRYEKDGYGYYELFTAGHARVRFPLKPGLFGGKRAADRLRQQYESFEAKLNSYGWKTVEKTN